jgi:hypothetical protein
MRKIILSLFGATLIAASMANAAMAAEHLTRHHKIYASERVRHAFASQNGSVFGVGNPWRSGIQPDDWRQSVNGG